MPITPLIINKREIISGSRITLELPLPLLYTHTPMTMPVHVIRGKQAGPHLFVCAAIHGDELNGVEIIRRLLLHSSLKRIVGTLIAIPIVNVYGVINNSRYLPDRRDLNRSFPGSERGTLAGRLAHLFMTEIVAKCSHGIDLHTGALHRDNLPQIRGDLDDPETSRLAKKFGVPVLINANLRDGSLRESAAALGIPMLLYEAGEALRFDELSIRAGVRGIINVMRELGMLTKKSRRKAPHEPLIARTTNWIRAPLSGIFRSTSVQGQRVKIGEVLGFVADPFGEITMEITSSYNGIIIGKTNIPVVHEGDALFHVARFEDVGEVALQVESFQQEHDGLTETPDDLPIV